jgi:NAD(P)-dependent dehydrogenase (short-subunit alcohol dehydrogenase family)
MVRADRQALMAATLRRAGMCREKSSLRATSAREWPAMNSAPRQHLHGPMGDVRGARPRTRVTSSLTRCSSAGGSLRMSREQPVDVTVHSGAAALVHAATGHYGRLDGAVNNAGGVAATAPVPDITDADWRAALDQNLTSVFYGLKHQIPAIGAAGGGSIVNNASIAGVSGIPGMASYVAAKHGVVGLTRSAALECAEGNVRINALVTGNVDTPLYRALLGVAPDADFGPAPNPSRRTAEPAEVAAFVAFLLSDEARFITGAALPIDGGATAA